MSHLAEITDAGEYAELLCTALPHVIHTEAENRRCARVLEELLRKKKRSPEERRRAELLSLLIEAFEHKEYGLLHAGPIDILRHLMEANGFRQVDLLNVFGTASVISEVLKGKRELSKTHIARLSERFHVSPALFSRPDFVASPCRRPTGLLSKPTGPRGRRMNERPPAPLQRLLSASNSSSVRGQSSRRRRESARSASSLPPVWHTGQ